jgi:hypothetical protein
MIDRYASQGQRQPLEQPAPPEGLEFPASPLHLDRDERLAGERSAA